MQILVVPPYTSLLSVSGALIYLDVDERDILGRLAEMKVDRIIGVKEGMMWQCSNEDVMLSDYCRNVSHYPCRREMLAVNSRFSFTLSHVVVL